MRSGLSDCKLESLSKTSVCETKYLAGHLQGHHHAEDTKLIQDFDLRGGLPSTGAEHGVLAGPPWCLLWALVISLSGRQSTGCLGIGMSRV